MDHILNVFDRSRTSLGKLTVIIGNSAVPTAKDPFLWRWAGNRGSGFGHWEWKMTGSDYRMVLTTMFKGTTWGSLTAAWKPLPTPNPGPTQPWFSKAGIRSGEITIFSDSSFTSGTWTLL